MNEAHDMAIMLSGEKIKELSHEINVLLKLRKDVRASQVKLLSESLGVDVEQTIKDYHNLVETCSLNRYGQPQPRIRIKHVRLSSQEIDMTFRQIISVSDKEKCIPTPILLKIYDALNFIHPKFVE